MTKRETGSTTGSKSDDPPDMADLARQFADLWQEQLSAMAADPDLARSMSETMQLWQQGMAGFAGSVPGGSVPGGSVPGGTPHAGAANDAMGQAIKTWTAMVSGAMQGGTNSHAQHTPQAASSPGTKAPATASDGGEQLLHELNRRLAGLEERLDHLERRLDGARTESGAPASGKAGSGKSGKRSGGRKSSP